MRENERVKTLVINGVTASGKSALAVDVALALRAQGRNAEVVNADSMLVYRGMDIGTAKPSVAERREVRHHLVDILEITQTATVAEIQRLARDCITRLRGRQTVPVVVGGSALYMRAILDHFEFPGTDPAVRSRLEHELADLGPEAIHAQLAAVAPEAAAEILPGNGRRIVRALEVVELTGSYTPRLPAWEYEVPDVVQVGLELDRATMDERIARRVDQMWADGLVDEVRALERQGLRDGLTASRALGYQQVLAFLAGECSEDEAREATVAGTRRFARKQLSWFRRDPRITWLPAQDPDNVERVVAMLE